MSETLKVKDGDLVIDERGQAVLISGVEKVSQDIAAVLLSTYDPARPWGLDLPQVASGVSFVVQTAVREALDRLQVLQQQDDAADTGELIQSIPVVEVRQVDQQTWVFYVEVETLSGERVERAAGVSLEHLYPRR